ncbi:nucleotidyltransferase domain-containing protein [Candidatus Parcubacteria bacterium]|nr:nucleotidyltransferase domain-containing protein [Candidatus Parcubacteria bacterium]
MTNKDIIKKARPILEKQGVKKAALFGSRARGDNKRNSDVDLLVDLPDHFTLFDVSSLKIDLEEKLKKIVDLVEYSMVHQIAKKEIFKEQIPII